MTAVGPPVSPSSSTQLCHRSIVGSARQARSAPCTVRSARHSSCPKTILNYGTGGSLDTAANALASTANLLRAHGWQAGAGYPPGETNFGAVQASNTAPVYQPPIALVGQ